MKVTYQVLAELENRGRYDVVYTNTSVEWYFENETMRNLLIYIEGVLDYLQMMHRERAKDGK